MLSTFHSIELGKKSLMNNQFAMNVTGNNLSNVNNPKYTRNRVHLETDFSLFPVGTSSPKIAGQIGMGAKISNIERMRDSFLEKRILNESSEFSYWNKLQSLFKQIEPIYNEPHSLNLRTSFQAFVEAWDKLGQYPSELSYRELVKTRALELTESIQKTYGQLREQQQQANEEIKSIVDLINSKISQVAYLNKEIRLLKAEKQNPNHLLDERDAIINELSRYFDLKVSYEDEDEQAMLFIGSQILVQGDHFESLDLLQEKEGMGLHKIIWGRYGVEIPLKSGVLNALVEIRDSVIPKNIKSLDHFAMQIVETVNQIHESGFSLKGDKGISFFKKDYIGNDSQGTFVRNGEVHLGYYRVSGYQQIKEDDLLGISGTLKFKDYKGEIVEVKYFESDKVADLIQRINNSSAQVFAYLDLKGQFSLKANPNFNDAKQDSFIKYIEDSDSFLNQYVGLLNDDVPAIYDFEDPLTENHFHQGSDFYVASKKHTAAHIALDENILLDIRNIAAARASESSQDFSSGKGDGRNALQIMAALSRTKEYELRSLKEIAHRFIPMDKEGNGFESYLQGHIQNLASTTEKASLQSDKSDAILSHLEGMRKSFSGVSLDEEMATILMYQRAYQASAQFINHSDKLLETLIFRLGA